jgi:hypothetical protein
MRDPVKEVALAAITALRRIEGESTEEIMAAEAYWTARAQRRHREVEPIEGKLIDGEKLERFQEFKRRVLAQAGKGQFYG